MPEMEETIRVSHHVAVFESLCGLILQGLIGAPCEGLEPPCSYTAA